ncbi:MAG: endonuclease domain-containing protein, partial [Gammaproteobacteria bacterium]
PSPLSLWERARVREAINLTTRAKQLRKNSTDAEILLWKHLRNRRLEGFKFKRQMVIEPYIVDFVCLELKLIVEADGGQHAEQVDYDTKRTAKLESLGYRVLRFWNNEIFFNTVAVLEVIRLGLVETT